MHNNAYIPARQPPTFTAMPTPAESIGRRNPILGLKHRRLREKRISVRERERPEVDES
jgi:hypothetical protein